MRQIIATGPLIVTDPSENRNPKAAIDEQESERPTVHLCRVRVW